MTLWLHFKDKYKKNSNCGQFFKHYIEVNAIKDKVNIKMLINMYNNFPYQ